MFIYHNGCIEKKFLEALNRRESISFLHKNEPQGILLMLVLKVREVNVISKTTGEVTVFVRS